MKIYSKAPLRIALAGGGTDVPPYTKENIGAVLNFTINKYVITTIENAPLPEVYIYLENYGKGSYISETNFKPILLISTTVEYFLEKYNKRLENVIITVASDVPPSSGLGSSSVVCVSVLGALHEFFSIPFNRFSIAVDAYKIERLILDMRGGSQDQFAAAYGGFNLMTFGHGSEHAEGTRVLPIRVSERVLNILSSNLMLFDTGMDHGSDDIIERQVEIYKEDPSMKPIYERAARNARLIADAIVREDIEGIYELIFISHENKIKFCPLIESEIIKDAKLLSLNANAKTFRIIGAGGGGHFLVGVDFKRRNEMKKILSEIGLHVDFSFEMKGLQTWRE